jgi:MATE family multidrug resistance protein
MSATNEKAAEQQSPPLTHLFFLCLSSLPNPTKHDPEKHIQLVPPTIFDIVSESKSLINLAFPMVLIALILYSRSILSMLFLGYLGDLKLADGSLAMLLPILPATPSFVALL